MKHWKLISGLGLATMLVFTGCSAQKSPSGDAPTSPAAVNADVSGAPDGDSGQTATESTDGMITAITETEVTIAKNPMTMRQPANQATDGAQAQADGQTPPADGQQGQPADAVQGQPPEGGQGQTLPDGTQGAAPASPDTSDCEKVTYKIDSQTKLSKMQLSDDNGREETAATLSELVVGANVRITARTDDESTADSIFIMNMKTDAAPAASPAQ